MTKAATAEAAEAPKPEAPEPEVTDAAPASDEAAPAAEPGADDAAAAEDADKAVSEAPEGTVYLKHPEGIGCSFRGIELAADKKGRVLAPASAAAELAAHGFEAL